jgi:CRISPR-associated endonuclease Cas2
MKTHERHYLIMYDITEPKTLGKIGKLMISEGMERVNYSVWIGWINPIKKPDLKAKLDRLLGDIKTKGSVFYILPLGHATLKQMRCLNRRKPKNLEYWLGEKREAFF